MDKRFLVLLGVLGVSFSSIFVKYANAPSAVLVVYRNGFAALFLSFPIFIKYRGEMRSLHIKEILICFLSGVFLGLHFFFFFESIKYTSVASSTALVNTEVFFVALMNLLFYKEKVKKKAAVGILITFIGSLIIAFGDGGEGHGALYGDIMAVLGAFSMSLYTMIGRRQRKNTSTAVYTFFVYLAAAVTMYLYCIPAGISFTGHGSINYAMALAMTLFCTFFGHSIFNYCLKYISPVFISTVKLGEPFFATVLALLIFKEMPGAFQISGAMLVVLGLYIYGRFER